MTVTGTLKLQDKITSTFKNATKAGQDFVNSGNRIDNTLKSMDSSMKSATSSSGSFFNSLLKFNVLQRIFGMVKGQLDSAIARYDTLQNYTKVMSNLGVSEEQAEASRKRLAEGLKGLPTTLDAGVLAVQRFTSANGNVAASTEMFLAMNNAILAGGANMGTQQTAMEQLAQAYSKGKPDMMEWRALLTAMPGQLKQIAKAMGRTTTELGEDLRSGKVSMNEFMKTAVQLNKEGIDGFANFAEQAKNSTGGIQTAIANMKSAISRGWVSMIEGANNALKASGLPTINQIIVNLGNTIEDVMSKIGSELLPSLGQGLADLTAQFQTFSNASTGATTESLDGWDRFMIGFNSVKLGFMMGLGYMQIFLLTFKIMAQGVINGLLLAFDALALGVETVAINIVLAVQDGINKVISLINTLIMGFNGAVEGFNNLFGWTGLHAEKADFIQDVTFGNEFAASIGQNQLARQNEISRQQQGIRDTAMEIINVAEDLGKYAQQQGGGLIEDVNKRNSPSEKAKENSTAAGDIGNLNSLMDSVVGTDDSGGKAIKTTSDDKLLSDDDIQLLLDVATRDYKLNYQQVTPNITLTFGDIRETADVDNILDQVADRLEEIYDSNLEVVTQ